MGGQGARFAIGLAATMILARLIAPGDFGLMAMVMVIVNFIGLFKDIGLSQATIQKRSITAAETSNLFWINLSVSMLLAVLVAATAPMVAAFYGHAELEALTVALGATVLFQGLGLQHRALLTRSMAFNRIAVASVAGQSCGAACAILMAFHGYGYWALFSLLAVSVVVECSLTWIFCGWVPHLPSRRADTRPYLSYGLNLVGFNIVNFLNRQMDNLLIGRFLGAGALGLYGKAYELLMLPLSQFNAPVTKVILPALSQLVHDDQGYRRFYYRSIRIAITITFPAVGFSFVMAEPLITVVLGGQWKEAAGIYRALAPAAFASALNITTGWVFLSRGTTDRQFRFALIAAPVTIACMAAGLPYGPVGVAWGVSLAYLLLRVPYLHYAFKGTPLDVTEVLKMIGMVLTPNVVAAAATLLATCLPGFDTSATIVQLGAGAVLYGSVLVSLDWIVNRDQGILTQIAFIRRNILGREEQDRA